MQVFISWSGERSRIAAKALQVWLRQVIQATEPWISADIEKGTRWNPEIAGRLEESRVGIIVLTRDNLESKWLHFEAGALSKTKEAHVCTLLLDLRSSDVDQPLGQFQHTTKTKDDLLRLIQAINGAVGKSGGQQLEDAVLGQVFETNWPKLERDLDAALSTESSGGTPTRQDRELLEEILEILRNQERREEVRRIKQENENLRILGKLRQASLADLLQHVYTSQDPARGLEKAVEQALRTAGVPATPRSDPDEGDDVARQGREAKE
jgi:hypothetical protein